MKQEIIHVGMGGMSMNGRREIAGRGRKKYSGPAPKMFNTIRETARITGLSEKYLRRIQKEEKLPGIYCGNRFMVNYTLLMRQITLADMESGGNFSKNGIDQ